MPAQFSVAAKLVVAAMIVALGALRLRDALRGVREVPSEHPVANHNHDGREAFHRPVSMARRLARAHRILAVSSGILAIAFGVAYARSL